VTAPRTAVRRLALGRVISMTGTSAAGTALTFTIYQQTRSTAWISATMLLTWAVIGFLGLWRARSEIGSIVGES
jgi:hypothetical protein